MSTSAGAHTTMRDRMDAVRSRLERLLLYRVWERLLEIEFFDRSVALAGKAFVAFFPLVIVVAAVVPADIRSSIIQTLTARLGFRGETLALGKEAFASSEDIRNATSVLGLVLTIVFAVSFTTALHRVYARAWRRPPRAGVGKYWRGISWLLVVLIYFAVLGAVRDALGDGAGIGLFAIVSVAASSALWCFSAWFFLLGDVRARVLWPGAVITGIAMIGFAASATIWMPSVVTDNQEQFGIFGIALSLVTWFSGAAMCILVGTCAGVVFAEDTGRVGSLIRGSRATTLTDGALAALPPPTRPLSVRDAFRGDQST